MTDPALANALAQIELLKLRTSEIISEIERLNLEQEAVYEKLDKLSHFVKIWHELADVPPPPMEERITPPAKEKNGKRAKNPPREVVVEMALGIIREQGKPIGRKELYDALAVRGIVIEGKDPLMTLNTMLWRSSDKIQYIKPLGYWIAGTPYDPAQQVMDVSGGRFDL